MPFVLDCRKALRANFPTQVRRVAWDAALSTGALRFIDYDLVAAVSEIYAMQDYYGDTARQLGTAVYAGPAMDPATSAIAVRQSTVTMREVVFAEELLIDLYRRQLPVCTRGDQSTEAILELTSARRPMMDQRTAGCFRRAQTAGCQVSPQSATIRTSRVGQ